jgi:putative methylase
MVNFLIIKAIIMKKKELEILLQKIPSFEKPIPNLEQYITSANIASDIIFYAYQFGDIKNKIIIDLGCGTGIFSVGTYLTGAKKVIGIDIDENAISIAREFSKNNKYDITFINQDVTEVVNKCDTVFMNPPFGAQKGNLKADRKFIEKGFEISSVIYSIHLTNTLPFITKLVSVLGGEINYSKEYIYSIKHSFNFHKKKFVRYNITNIRIITNG